MKDRQFTLLNLIGLSTGLACTLLIYMWVSDELSFDKFHEKNDQIYQLMESRRFPGKVDISDESSGLLGETIAREFPEVEYAAAEAPASWFQKFTLTVGDKNIKGAGQYVGKDYFNIFSFKLLDGNKNTVLRDKHSIVISEDLARKLFGTTEHLIGKGIQVEHDSTFFVSGVFERIPEHSSEQFDFVQPFDYYKDLQNWVGTWDNMGPHNFILLKKGTDINLFNKKIASVISRHCTDTFRTAYAYKFSDNYLHNSFIHGNRTGGKIEYVRMFSLIAIFILVIACINFMNLSTAKASKRLKEVGIKKVIGANRRQLIFQYIGESLVISFLALLVAVGLVALMLPEFNQLTGKQMSLMPDINMVAAALCIAGFTGLIAGSYPALYLSGFRPVEILKGKLISSVGEVWIRRGLVVFQFSLSVLFIVAVGVVYQQMKLVHNINLGFSKDNVIRFGAEGRVLGHEESFLAGLKNIPGVVNASGTFHNIIGKSFGVNNLEWEGKNPKDNNYIECMQAGYDLIPTMGMEMQSGRNFSKGYSDSLKMILNESAVHLMGLKNPIGANLKWYGDKYQVIGVVKNFHFESLHEPIRPLFLTLANEAWNGYYRTVVRIAVGREKETLDRIEKYYAAFNPGFKLEYVFLDEVYQKQYASENQMAVLSKYFAGLTILISCLGLFGLAAFTAQRRRKEIGVRKVLGASEGNIVGMLSKEFVQLVSVSIIIASPVAWLVMNNWLNGFSYRTGISVWLFVLSGAIALLIALGTVSVQAIRAAVSNPVNSLRSE
jgi:ABC-type antimicrobial peptide transport system permease subunit